MKRGYKRLAIFELLILIILFINSFVSNILSNYYMIIFLLIIVVSFKLFFGFEKDRHRYTKDILYDLIIFLIIFFIFYYLSGLIFSFAKTESYYNLHDFIFVLLPIILEIILKEFLRYQTLNKAEGSKFLIVLTTMLFIFWDISTTLFYNRHQNTYGLFIYLALTVIPAISLNIASTYINLKVGYKPMIVYRLVMELYLYLLPIVPNPNQYIVSVIRLLLPIIFAYQVYKFFLKEHDEEVEREKKKVKITSLILTTLLVAFLVYFTSGYFHYHAIVIASGSMTPMIRKGDVVVIEKSDGNFEDIKEGQVIAYKYDGIVIVHRLVEKVKVEDEYYFYTKGDANETRDNYKITEDMVIGVVNIKVPYIGLPTVWLNEL